MIYFYLRFIYVYDVGTSNTALHSIAPELIMTSLNVCLYHCLAKCSWLIQLANIDLEDNFMLYSFRPDKYLISRVPSIWTNNMVFVSELHGSNHHNTSNWKWTDLAYSHQVDLIFLRTNIWANRFPPSTVFAVQMSNYIYTYAMIRHKFSLQNVARVSLSSIVDVKNLRESEM